MMPSGIDSPRDDLVESCNSISKVLEHSLVARLVCTPQTGVCVGVSFHASLPATVGFAWLMIIIVEIGKL